MESAATIDVLVATGVMSVVDADTGKAMLIRIMQMLTQMAPPGQ